MTHEIRCTLCSSNVELFCEINNRAYYKCVNCSSILLDPRNLPSREEEKRRYEEHNNDVNDPRYQKFVAPIVDEIKADFTPGHTGLDFGAGTGPVITKLLRDSRYKVDLYDPLFWDHPEVLNKTYDYIACCEVMEHFHNPRKEFARLHSLLKSNGVLYCITDLYSEDIDFRRWYYKNDRSHAFFYHKDALEWICSHLQFSQLEIKCRLIRFTKGLF